MIGPDVRRTNVLSWVGQMVMTVPIEGSVRCVVGTDTMSDKVLAREIILCLVVDYYIPHPLIPYRHQEGVHCRLTYVILILMV